MSSLPNPNGIKQGDTVPLVVTLNDVNGPADIANATVVFRMKSRVAGSGHDPIEAAAVNLQGVDGGGNATNVGMVEYDWLTGETDIPGVYGIEYVVTYLDGTKRTFPNDRQTTFEIFPAA